MDLMKSVKLQQSDNCRVFHLGAFGIVVDQVERLMVSEGRRTVSLYLNGEVHPPLLRRALQLINDEILKGATDVPVKIFSTTPVQKPAV